MSSTPIQRYQMVLASMSAVLFYEYIVTFGQEYRYIWHAKRWSAVRIAFLINRYCAIVEFTFFLVNNFSGMSDATCARVHFLPQMLATCTLLATFTIQALRVHAIWNRHMAVIIALGLDIVFNGALAIWLISGNKHLTVPSTQGGCLTLLGSKQSKYSFLVTLSYFSFDVACLTLVLARVVYSRRTYGANTPILMIITRDHLAYFGIVSSAVFVNVLFLKLYTPAPYIAIPVSTALTTIVCSRLVLSMRARASEEHTTSSGGGAGVHSSSKHGGATSRVVKILQSGVQHFDVDADFVERPDDNSGSGGKGVGAIKMAVMRSVHSEGPDGDIIEKDPTGRKLKFDLEDGC